MDTPWGITGPQFLALYSAGLVIAVGIAVFVRYRARRPAAPDERFPPLDIAGLAFLAGGPRRVVEVAIARLIEVGALRPIRGGQVAAVTNYAPHPLDAAVLDETGPLPRAVSTVIRRATVNPVVTAIGDALVRQKLLLAPKAARRAQRRAVLALHLLLLVGVIRLINGVWRDYPVAYLAVLLALTLVLALVLGGKRLPARTVHGDDVLSAARDGDQHLLLGPSAAMMGAAGVVALSGLALFPDGGIRQALAMNATSSGSSWAYSGGGSSYIGTSCGSSSSDSGSSGGSSCGGSSSGGSSCGGGGGGGCGGGSS
ncbi:MAG TPA: TIGR04222 domain-containing membrane protein [Pseudonocardiaceae bacterium]